MGHCSTGQLFECLSGLFVLLKIVSWSVHTVDVLFIPIVPSVDYLLRHRTILIYTSVLLASKERTCYNLTLLHPVNCCHILTWSLEHVPAE